MRMLFPMIIMLISGLAMGSAGSTLLWSGMLSRSHDQQKETMGIVKDWEGTSKKWETVARRFEKIANENQTGWKECLTLAKANIR